MALVNIFLSGGLKYKQAYKVQLPRLECAHKTRARMLDNSMEGIKTSHRLWRQLTSSGVEFELAPTESQLNIVGSDQHLGTQKRQVERHLVHEAAKCARCKSDKHQVADNNHGDEGGGGDNGEGDEGGDGDNDEDDDDNGKGEDDNGEDDEGDDGEDDDGGDDTGSDMPYPVRPEALPNATKKQEVRL